MPDKTAEQLQKEKADADAEIARLAEEKRKADERVANAEKKFNEWAGEVGGIRKIGDALKAALDEAKATLSEVTNLIADLKAGKIVGKAPGGKPTEDDAEGKKLAEALENAEKGLSESQRKAVEAAFALMTDVEKVQYENDPEFRLSIFKRAQEAAPAIPSSPWKTAPKSKKPGDDAVGYKSILDRIFDTKRKNRFVPAGPQGGATVLVDGNQPEPNEPPEDTRVH
jgi:flagellar hook-basal body complex protein FliE